MNQDLYNLLNILKINPNLSQRELSQRLNISLGKTNSLLKKLLSEKKIKIVEIDSRTKRYYLEEEGENLRSDLILNSIEEAYYLIEKLKIKLKIIKKLNSILKTSINILLPKNNPTNSVILHILNSENINYRVLENIEELENITKPIYIFHSSLKEELKSKNLKYINILEEI